MGIWTGILPSETKGRQCASQDCENTPEWRFESGGVGSYYCSECKAKIKALAAGLKQYATN
jgi:hypothetical protein